MHTLTQILEPTLVLVLTVGLILVRQMSWRDESRVRRIGLALLGLGVLMLVTGNGGVPLPRATAGLTLAIAIMLATAVVGGLALGLATGVRGAADGTRREVRGGGLGLAVWLAVIAVRVAESFFIAHLTGPAFAHSTGAILVSVGTVRVIGLEVALRRGRQAPEAQTVRSAPGRRPAAVLASLR